MAPQAKAWMSWSSGKDSAMALDLVRSEGIVEVTAILTTVNADADRVAMHAVRRTLLEAQADRLDLPLVTIEIPAHCSNETYEARMAEAIAGARADEITHMIFGDLFLRDVRSYREDHLAGTGISPIFPLWDRPTNLLAHEMLRSCGENGEFHTFVWNGPGFNSPIDIEIGQVIERDGFTFCDVSTL
jgi:diphthamide synthase (EF-2-diphthine--ammonia ligase)